MARSRSTPKKRGRRRGKAAPVRKLSPDVPAARDEGPRLIPLGPSKDQGLARIEHYLALADKALGHALPVKTLPASSYDFEPPASPEPSLPSEVVAEPVSDLEPASGVKTLPSLPPKLNWPKPPVMQPPPPPPKLAMPKPPKAPAFPSPPKLSVPKPPRRRDRSS